MLLSKDYIGEICEFMWPLDCNVIVYADAYDRVLVKRYDEKLESVYRHKTADASPVMPINCIVGVQTTMRRPSRSVLWCITPRHSRSLSGIRRRVSIITSMVSVSLIAFSLISVPSSIISE